MAERESASAPFLYQQAAPGGALKRWLLYQVLRRVARRAKVAAGDIGRLRARNALVDRWLIRVDPALRRTSIDAGGVPAQWIEVPESRQDRTLYYLHGGAFCLRFPNVHAALAGRWCRRLGARALLVDYRLAPEHPYPAALDDCSAAYRWLLERSAPQQIVCAGDSAGGNLVLALLHRLKAQRAPMPRCAVLLSPVVDFTLSSPSLITNAERDPVFTLEKIVALRLLYATPEQYLEPTLSPLFGDFRDFPPLLFQAGEIEMLRDESVRAGDRAHAAGVKVEVEIWRHMAHVFQAFPLPQATLAEARIAAFIERQAGWTTIT